MPPPGEVLCYAVVPSPLDVQGHQVEPKVATLKLEQPVGHLRRHVLVDALSGLVHEADDETVHGSRLEEFGWVEELRMQGRVCENGMKL